MTKELENSEKLIQNDSLITTYSLQWGNHFNFNAEDEKAKLFYLQYFKHGLKKFAHLAKNKTDLMNSQMLIEKSYKFLGKYQKSNKILFETLEELSDDDDDHKLKDSGFGNISNNYSHLKSPKISADHHLKAHEQFKLAHENIIVAVNGTNLIDIYNIQGKYPKIRIQEF